jgi:hypothetical protein
MYRNVIPVKYNFLSSKKFNIEKTREPLLFCSLFKSLHVFCFSNMAVKLQDIHFALTVDNSHYLSQITP